MSTFPPEPIRTEVKHDAPLVALNENEGATLGQFHIQRWNAESKIFSFRLDRPSELALAAIQLSGLERRSYGERVATSTRMSTGQMLIPVQSRRESF